MVRRFGCEISNVINEANLKVATFLLEKVVEELLVSLGSTLDSLVSSYIGKNKRMKIETDNIWY